MQKGHAARLNTVKREGSCLVIQVYPNTGRPRHRYVSTLVIVHKWVFRPRAVQAPGLVVPAQAALVAGAFAAYPPVGNSDVSFCASPVHLPVATIPSQDLPAQHLE